MDENLSLRTFVWFTRCLHLYTKMTISKTIVYRYLNVPNKEAFRTFLFTIPQIRTALSAPHQHNPRRRRNANSVKPTSSAPVYNNSSSAATVCPCSLAEWLPSPSSHHPHSCRYFQEYHSEPRCDQHPCSRSKSTSSTSINTAGFPLVWLAQSPWQGKSSRRFSSYCDFCTSDRPDFQLQEMLLSQSWLSV